MLKVTTRPTRPDAVRRDSADIYDLTPREALSALREHVLVDGFEFVLDFAHSRGSRLRNALTGDDFIDFYSFFASAPIGYNHPRLHDPVYEERLLTAAALKVANPDVYTQFYGEFVRTFAEIAALPGLDHYFFIDGGALAIENGLKIAFDWKVRKNLAAGRGEIGHKVLHFKQAFHGRSGYTLSLTNTADPRKIAYFPKFDWPRIENPKIDFSLPPADRDADAAAREKRAIQQIENTVARFPHEIACMIIEPIQGEGGDNHFRPEFLRELRRLADQHDFLLIFDEVQTGVGLTGRMWACEHFGVTPDILCFGKKMQICGLMCSTRVDEVDSVFKIPSRINSTWGGNVADMVRSTQYLKIIRDENLSPVAGAGDSASAADPRGVSSIAISKNVASAGGAKNAASVAAARGETLQQGLHDLAQRHSGFVTAVRGRGLMCAFDLPDTPTRDAVRKSCYANKLMILACGERSLRFRPVLDIPEAALHEGLEILNRVLISARA